MSLRDNDNNKQLLWCLKVLKDKFSSIVHDGKEIRLNNMLNTLESDEIEGLADLIVEFKNLKQTDFYENLCQTVDLDRKIIASKTSVNEIKENSHIISLAKTILSNPPIYSSSISGLIYFKMFYVMYTFLEAIYYTNSGNKLEHKDLMNILYGSS